MKNKRICPVCKKPLSKDKTPHGEYLRCWTYNCHKVFPLYKKENGRWVKIG